MSILQRVNSPLPFVRGFPLTEGVAVAKGFGEPVVTRPLQAADWPSYRCFLERNEGRMRRAAISGLATQASDFIRWLVPDSARPFELTFGLFDIESRLGGLVGVEVVPRFDGAGVWYAADPACQGHGWVKTAVLHAMVECLAPLRARGSPLKRWVLHVLPSNNRSTGLALSLGFQRDTELDYRKRSSARGGRLLHGYRLAIQPERLAQQLQSRLAAPATQR